MTDAAPTPLLDGWPRAGLWLALVPVLAWAAVSLTELTHASNVPWALAWIPAAATDGVMIVATQVCLRHVLEPAIRRYAATLVVLGAGGSILAAGAQHYLVARELRPPPELAAALGGLPSLMAALLVHIIVMIGAQARRESLAAAAVRSEAELLSDARRLRADADTERGAAEVARAAAESDRESAGQAARDAARERERATQMTQSAVAPRGSAESGSASVTRLNTTHRADAATRQRWIARAIARHGDVTAAQVRAQFPGAKNARRDIDNVKARLDQPTAKEA